MRCQTAGNSLPPSPESYRFSSTATPGAAEFPNGLPPPPRRSRGPKPPSETRTNSVVEEAQGQENQEILAAIPVLSNPYINPAPTLDDVGMPSKMSVTSPMTKGASRDQDGSADCALPWSPVDAQKFIPTQRSTQNSDNALAEHPVSVLPRSRGRGEFVPDAKKSALNMRRTGNEARGPLISHGHLSSISSFDSVSSSSTNEPVSTAENEPRISISSTIYPASSTQSHSHSLYNQPVPNNYRDSFMDLYSPAIPEFNIGGNSPVTDGSHEPISPIRFSGPPILKPAPFANSGQKPPLPTAPKPKFTRVTTKSRQPSPMSSTPPPIQSDLPPTTNFLDMDERADLVRKSRKLARVFGQTPGADAMAQQDSGRSTNGGQRSWRSVREPFGVTGPRRHSMPLSPDDVSFLSIKSPTFDSHPSPTHSNFQSEMDPRGKPQSSDVAQSDPPNQIRSSPPTSFIDLSDDGAGAIKATSPTVPNSPSHSFLETMSLEESVDDERKRKRERLAKLHRFLGSRVPANLVLGIDDVEASLPPPTSPMGSESDDANVRKIWIKRRRSSSAGLTTPTWNDSLERSKAELDDREKAINVRRAQKMEKVFGVAPPQTLYHTRQGPVPARVVARGTVLDDAPQVAQRNVNKAAYNKPKKNNRPGTAESSKQLLPKGPGSLGFDEPAASPNTRHSLIYNHYQHSLNSLNVILDRDDRESLAELHQYLNNPAVPTSQLEDETPNAVDRRLSVSSSIKSERRRSLPARTSMISLASEYTISTPKAEITAFQLRRRRAAKLTQFFGVNYRELINDILDSIENGVQHEQQRGTLRAEEVEDLLSKLRSLKTKRQGLF